jgi:hypothetical protein
MELTECEKCVLEHIFLSQPSSKEVIITADAFARMLGHSWTEEEIRHALASLTSRQLILEVTPKIAASILKGLRGVHGPLVPIGTASHYSVTAAGGSARLAYCPLDDPLGLGGRGVVSVEHSQFFTPVESLADQLVATDVFSSNKLGVFNVYLAPNNENAGGFIADLLADPSAPSHPIKLLYEHVTLLQRELEQSSGKQSIRTCDGLTHSEVWALIRLSGYTGSSAFQGVEENDIQSLLKNGLVRELQKEEAIQLNQRLLSRHSIPFGPKPRSRMRSLSNTGRDSLFQILDAMPSLKQHLMASRVVGEYVHQYFPSIDRALEAQTKLKESGKSVTNIERIGRWCYYWWDVHAGGARFSYWNGDIA